MVTRLRSVVVRAPPSATITVLGLIVVLASVGPRPLCSRTIRTHAVEMVPAAVSVTDNGLLSQDPLRRASARSSAPSLMLRTTSARPLPTAGDRPGATRLDRTGVTADHRRASVVGAVVSAGTITIVASSVKSRMPTSRARIDASTSAPSDSRLPRSADHNPAAKTATFVSVTNRRPLPRYDAAATICRRSLR